MSYEIFSLNNHAKMIGTIRPSGEVFTRDGARQGRISANGEIKDMKGNKLGTVNHGGVLFSDVIDTSNYKISREGTIMHIGEVIGAVKQKEKGILEIYARWGAFALFHQEFVQEDFYPEDDFELSDDADNVLEDEDDEIGEELPLELVAAVSEIVVSEPIKHTHSKEAVERTVEKTISRAQDLPNIESLEFYAQKRIEAFMKKKKREIASKAE